jgi:hypothetical protein
MKGQGGDHITSSQIFDDGTTVRIPGALQVTGSIVGSSTATFSDTVTISKAAAISSLIVKSSSSTTGLWLYLNGLNATLSNQDSGSLAFQTNGTDRLTISSAGAATFTGALSGTTATFSGAFLKIGTQSDIVSTAGLLLGFDASTIEMVASTFSSGYGAKFEQADPGDGFTYTRLFGRANTTSWTQNLSINNTTGAATFSNIIGVNGATEAGWSIKSNGNSKVESGSGTTVMQINDTSTGGRAWSFISAGAGNVHSVPAGNFYLRNSTDGITAFSILPTTGNIGFGRVSARGKAEFVTGLPTSIPTFTNTTNGIVVSDGGAVYGRVGVSNFSAASAGYPTYIQAGDFDGAIYYNLLLNPLGGNVGIGTSSPSQKLEVVGGEIKAGRVDSSSEGGQVSFGRASDNATGYYIDVFGSTSTPDLRFVDVSNSAVRTTITSGGQLRVGTNASAMPGALLSVGTGGFGAFGVMTQGQGAGTWDTGVSINQGNAGMAALLMASQHFSDGTSTQSALYLINFFYDGNNTPSTFFIAGSNFLTFGKSGSNTLTITASGVALVQFTLMGNS